MLFFPQPAVAHKLQRLTAVNRRRPAIEKDCRRTSERPEKAFYPALTLRLFHKQKPRRSFERLGLWRTARDAAAAATPCVCRPRAGVRSDFGAENLPPAAFLFAPHPLRVLVGATLRGRPLSGRSWNKKRAAHSNDSGPGALQGTQPPRLRLASAVLAQGCARTSARKTCPRQLFFSRLTRSWFESLQRSSFSCLHKKKRAAHSNDSLHMARCKGLEPLTFWFVAKHSIQLS